MDTNGTIIIWDVTEGSVLTLISGTKELKSVESIEWIAFENSVQNFLLVLYRNNCLVLYDTEFGEIVWTKKLELNVNSFSLDPFCKHRVLFGIQSKDCSFATIDDLIPKRGPNIPLKVFGIKVSNNVKTNGLNQKYNLWIKSDKTTVESNLIQNESIHICFHRSVRNQLLVAFNREVLVIDLSIEAIICCVQLERNCSNLKTIFSCRLRNAFFICHEFGAVSLRLFQKKVTSDPNEGTTSIHINYANLCQSDGLRLIKQNKIFGYSMSPIDETKVALLLNNGRIIIKRVHKLGEQPINESTLCLPYICDLIPSHEYLMSETKSKSYRIVMSHLLPALSYSPHFIPMCPAVTLRNWPLHRPLLAVGNSSGTIQVCNLLLSSLERELSIHSFPVRGIEWTGLETFISFAFPNISPHSGKTNNELNISDIISGRTHQLRTERNMDSSPIESLRISHLKQYLIICFKEDPFEIWDLTTLSLLRVMPKQFSAITAIEWSPLYNKRIENSLQMTASTAQTFHLHSKENFVVTNISGELFHFSIEGNIVKEITNIPPDTDMSATITCIAWKSDQVLLGDAVGNLNAWDLKRKVSKIEPTHRGPIKRIRFGPGRGNMKFLVLFNDGVDIWDIKDFKMNAQLKHPRDITFRVTDIDWAASDRPVLCTSEGTILVTDMKLRQYTSSMSELMSETNTEDIDLNSINFDLMSRMSRFIFRSKLILNQWNGSPKLPDCDIERNILVSKLFNDFESYQFWSIVSYVMTGNKERLDQNNDIFVDNTQFREIQSQTLTLLDAIRTNYSQNRICYELFIRLNQPQRAVQLLLETEPSMDGYYVDALKACLIAALQSNSEDSSAHPVVKLVATNMIASGRVGEGSQLLCLIGKTQDACRYLQSDNKWLESVFLAKVY